MHIPISPLESLKVFETYFEAPHAFRCLERFGKVVSFSPFFGYFFRDLHFQKLMAETEKWISKSGIFLFFHGYSFQVQPPVPGVSFGV